MLKLSIWSKYNWLSNRMIQQPVLTSCEDLSFTITCMIDKSVSLLSCISLIVDFCNRVFCSILDDHLSRSFLGIEPWGIRVENFVKISRFWRKGSIFRSKRAEANIVKHFFCNRFLFKVWISYLGCSILWIGIAPR